MVLEIFIFLILDYIASIATTKQNIKTDTNVLLSSINIMEIALSGVLLSSVKCHGNVLLSFVTCHGNRTFWCPFFFCQMSWKSHFLVSFFLLSNVMEMSFFLLSHVMEIALSSVLLSSIKCHGNRTL